MVLRAARRWTTVRLDRRPALVAMAMAMAVVMAGAAALLCWRGLNAGPAAPVLPWWTLAVAFVATDVCARHVQVRREAELIGISELPLVLGLFFAGPVQLFVGRLVGMALVGLLYRRAPLLKTAWNLALVALQTAVAGWVFGLVAGHHGVTHLLAGWALSPARWRPTRSARWRSRSSSASTTAASTSGGSPEPSSPTRPRCPSSSPSL
jgi:uncharacterized membrane protein